MSHARRKTLRRNSDKILFETVHGLEKCSQHLKIINEYMKVLPDTHPAKQSFDFVIKTYDNIMAECCAQVKRNFDE